jgi:hypothetical protein
MCMECLKELGRPSFEPFILPYYDERQAVVECSRHHKSVLLLQSQKFEVLLESGVGALAAGFTLEAAASFSSALERFYEFSLKVILVHRNTDLAVYEMMFKEMANQSERQLGAFLALHAVEFGVAYCPNKKIVEIRNSIVHKGVIPSQEKAMHFCEMVYNEILLLTEKLQQNCASAINEVISQDVRKRAGLLPKGTPTATTTGTMFYSLANKDKKATFVEAYDAYLKARDVIESAVPALKDLASLLRSATKSTK